MKAKDTQTAGQALAELEARIDAGDVGITSEQLVSARTAAEIEQRQEAAAVRVEEARRERERLDRIERIVTDLDAYARTPEFVQAETALREAITTALETFDAIHESRRRLISELRSLGDLPEHGDVVHVVDGIQCGLTSATIRGQSIHATHPDASMSRVIAEVRRHHVNHRRQAAQDRRQNLHVVQHEAPQPAA